MATPGDLPKASSKKEYEDWFKVADKNNDGVLNTKELKAMFKTRGYKMKSKAFKQQFTYLDSDHDKKITLDEYLAGMGHVPEVEHKESEIRVVFEKYDKDSDGQLDLDEIKEALQSITSGLTNKEMFDLMHKVDTDGSGTIDYDEFLQLYLREKGHADGVTEFTSTTTVITSSRSVKSSPGSVTHTQSAGSEDHKKWFNEADINNDGFLTSKELQKALKKKGYKTSRKQLKEQFKSFDMDGDKKISLEEYLICMGQVPEVIHKEVLIREAFEKGDKNNDGLLDIGELNTILQDMREKINPDEIFGMVSKMDKDKSGQIDYNEFLNYFLKEQGYFD